MSKDQYLAYIAHFVTHIAGLTTNTEWRKYLGRDSVLGDDLFAADDAAIKKLARHLYRSYVLAVFSRHGAFMIAEKMSDKQIEEYLSAILALDKKYKMDYNTISFDIDQKSADAHIKRIDFVKWKSVLAKLDPKNSPTRIKKEAAAEREKAKAARAAKKPTTKKSTTTKKTAVTKKPATTTKKPAAKKPTKSCDSHNLTELKALAKEKGLSGYSKLNKADLCKLLKIK
jgi:hypothetical protein